MSRLARSLTFAFICLATLPLVAEDDAAELFQQRIMPIFRSPNPSSCVQCHLSAVDLKDYILPSAEQTFVSLRDQGLVDLQRPAESKILKLIGMGDDDSDQQAKRIHAKTRKAEYEAFQDWIVACCGDQRLRDLPAAKEFTHAKPAADDGLIRHARKDRVLDSFLRNIWSQRMRCFPCHTPDEIDANNPQHVKPKQRHQEFVKKYGAKMNIFRDGPESTMRALITSSRRRSSKHLPLLNLEEPTQSLLVLKPTSKVPQKKADGTFEKPSSLAPVSHMGGLKMHVDDQSYKAMVAWIADYAQIANERYQSSEDLPRDNWYPSKHVLRVKDVPEDWAAMSRVQLFVHSRDQNSDSWNEQPIAFTQSLVTPRRFVNGSLFLLKADGQGHDWDPEGVELAAGRYQVRIFLDANHQLEQDPTAMLGEADFRGSIEVDAHWGQGFKNAEVVSASKLGLALNE